MKKILILSLLIAMTPSWVSAQIVIDNSITLSDAVGILLGPNVQFSNVTFNGASNPTTTQFGSFNSTNANVGIDSGIILATGDVMNAEGPNDSGSSSLGGGLFGASDPDLDALDGLTHNDVAVLEFDFVATGSTVSFQYVWASDEYPEYSGADGDGDGISDCGNVSDVFGFFLSGPGINGPFVNNAENIALIPGSSQFVSIFNLNAGCDNSATPGDLDCNFCEYYIANGDGLTAPYNASGTYVQYDGLTVILTAVYEGLDCGETYHIKLAVADVSDTAFDSAVFLKEGSFDVSGTVIEAFVSDPLAPQGATTLVEGCIDGALVLYPPACSADESIVTLEYGGIAINGLDYEELPETVTLLDTAVVLPIVPLFDLIDDEISESIEIAMYYINSDNVPDTAYASINIDDYYAPSVVVEDVVICEVVETAYPIIQDGYGPYNFNWGGGGNDSLQTYAVGDSGTYALQVVDYCGVPFETSFTVIEPDTFVVAPKVDNCLGQPTGTLARGGTPPYTVIYAEDSLLALDDYSYFANQVGTYYLTFTDQCGQTATSKVETTVCDTQVPNIFTPNGDGDNDTFYISGLDGFRGSTITIFDRWGIEVFSQQDYRNDWSGKENADGVYYYIFERADGKIYTGYFHKVSE
jgi:gliding motility-associated-like protein